MSKPPKDKYERLIEDLSDPNSFGGLLNLRRNIPKAFFTYLEEAHELGVPLHRLIDRLDLGSNDKPAQKKQKEKPNLSLVHNAPDVELNSDQKKSLKDIKRWLKSGLPYYALRGSAGTGKSTLMGYVRALANPDPRDDNIENLGYNFHFSAPTNKASKVLAEALGVQVKTTYSLLGARMSPNEEKMILSLGEPPDLGKDPILIVDEAGMVPTILLDLIMKLGYRCLFVGDPAQLNPVGERISPVWEMTSEHKTTLRKVERFDNQLLKVATRIRQCLKTKHWRSPIENDNDGKEGVFVVSRAMFERKIKALSLDDWDNIKVCAWRNKTVEGYNNLIREALGFIDEYEEGDRLLVGAPVLSDGGRIIAYTDEEVVVSSVSDRVISIHEADIPVYVFDVNRSFMLYVPKDKAQYERHKSRLAALASKESGKARAAAWSRFWEFCGSFHSVRYGYALTSHRAQGSTFNHVFVDQSDILANPTKPEAFRSLYVCATRPKLSLTTF